MSPHDIIPGHHDACMQEPFVYLDTHVNADWHTDASRSFLPLTRRTEVSPS